MAHDFNNLLTAVVGNLELIGQAATDRGDRRTERLTGNALRATSRGARLTSQLLAFSRRQRLRPERVIVSDLVREMGELIRRAAGETIQVGVRSDPQLWPCFVDPAQFESALLNLVINARDAMPGGGTLTISAGNTAISKEAAASDIAPGEYVRVDVADIGTGIAPEHLPRLFEPFFTTKEVGRGSGLGLAMVHGFARQSGGAVLIDTEEGRGTTVSLLLPRTTVVMAAAPSGEPAPPPAPPQAASGTVLLVEYDPEVLDVVQLILLDAGHRVLPARDGGEALELLRSRAEIDLLLSDVVPPGGKSGIEVAREARRLRPDLNVLLTSGYAEEVLRQHGADQDDFAMLPKPYSQAELLRHLAAAIGRTGRSAVAATPPTPVSATQPPPVNARVRRNAAPNQRAGASPGRSRPASSTR